MSARAWLGTRRVLADGSVVAGPGGRLARLTRGEDLAASAGGADAASRARLSALGGVPGAADVDALARDLVATGLLNWAGPATHVVVASGGGAAMSPETARAVVDFAFSTPRPTLRVEIVDEDGRGEGVGRFALEYARRKAEWRRRGLALSWRVRRAPAPELAEFLGGHRAATVAELRAQGAPQEARLFAAASARVLVERGARAPEDWVDALSRRGVSGVRWEPAPAAFASPEAARRFAGFAGRALTRMIDAHEESDLRDERAVALLSARPWEVPGVELLETLAYAPDGSVFASEEGWRRSLAGDACWRLGACADLRFQDLPQAPLARAIAAAAWRPAHPVCGDCPYQSVCAIPLSSGGGGVLTNPWCLLHTALLDSIFSYPDRNKCLNALIKWGVDISRIAC